MNEINSENNYRYNPMKSHELNIITFTKQLFKATVEIFQIIFSLSLKNNVLNLFLIKLLSQYKKNIYSKFKWTIY